MGVESGRNWKQIIKGFDGHAKENGSYLLKVLEGILFYYFLKFACLFIYLERVRDRERELSAWSPTSGLPPMNCEIMI